jgi:hypothetical protein
MPEVRPDGHEEGKEELGPVLADIVDAFRQLRREPVMLIARGKATDREENVANVHGQENGDSNVCEVDVVTPSDQPERDNVLSFSRLCKFGMEVHSHARRAP